MRFWVPALLFVSLCAHGAITVYDDRVTEHLAAIFARGGRPSIEHFRLGELWTCFHHYSQPAEGREENALQMTEFIKIGDAITVREGRLYPGRFMKGQRFSLSTPTAVRALKDPMSSTYLNHDATSKSLVVRFGGNGLFGTSYMICRPFEGQS